MPRHAKSTKLARDHGVLRGMRAHFHRRGAPRPQLRKGFTAASVEAVFREHLEALDAVTRAHAAWQSALVHEAALEAKIKAILRWLDPLLRAQLGDDRVVDFGLKPRVRRPWSVATKLRAVEKRRATRAANKKRKSA